MGNVIKIVKEEFPVNLLKEIYPVFTPEQEKEYMALYNNDKNDIKATLMYILYDSLNDRFVDILRMRFEQEMTYAQIGKVYGITPECVRQSINRSCRTVKLHYPLSLFFSGVKAHYAAVIKQEKQYSYESGKSETILKLSKLESEAERNMYMNQENPFHTMPLSEFAERFNLSMRTRNCIRRCAKHGLFLTSGSYCINENDAIKTVGELIEFTESEMTTMHNLGAKSLAEIKEALTKIGLAFRKENDE